MRERERVSEREREKRRESHMNRKCSIFLCPFQENYGVSLVEEAHEDFTNANFPLSILTSTPSIISGSILGDIKAVKQS